MSPTILSDVRRRRLLAIAGALAIVVLTCWIYQHVGSYGFSIVDDDEYVHANPAVTAGVTATGLRESFRFHAGNWHPLTWMSHMLDVQLFGLDPGPQHRINLLLHVLNAVVLLFALIQLTGAIGRSTIVAAIFAAHPLNVENVVWIAERKTLLAAFWMLLAIAVYARWARTASRVTLGCVYVCAALAIMAKPVAIVLPALLVVLDFWPLRRPLNLRSVIEKLPLFAFAALSAGLTFLAQSAAGAVSVGIPLDQRLLNAAVSSTWYLEKAFWPASLTPFYPHPFTLGQAVSIKAALLSIGVLSAASALAFAVRRRLPFLLAGLLWYLLSLLPVVGIVQVGVQARADRYAYVPLLGIFVAIVWTAGDLLTTSVARRAAAFCSIAIVLLLAGAARVQAARWQTNEGLYRYAAAVDPNNWNAWANLGVVALHEENYARAIEDFTRSFRLYPQNALVAFNAGYAYSMLNAPAEAASWYETASRLAPKDVKVLVARALTYRDLGQYEIAAECARAAVLLDEHDPTAIWAYGLTAASLRNREGAQWAIDRLRSRAPGLAAEVAAAAP